jgi:hypothetical protein
MYVGIVELKEVAMVFHGAKDEYSARVYTDALEALKERLSKESFKGFLNSL